MIQIGEAICRYSYSDLRAPITLFELMQQDAEEVFMLANYYIERSADKETEKASSAPISGKQSDGRIRVNDKTATGGWY